MTFTEIHWLSFSGIETSLLDVSDSRSSRELLERCSSLDRRSNECVAKGFAGWSARNLLDCSFACLFGAHPDDSFRKAVCFDMHTISNWWALSPGIGHRALPASNGVHFDGYFRLIAFLVRPIAWHLVLAQTKGPNCSSFDRCIWQDLAYAFTAEDKYSPSEITTRAMTKRSGSLLAMLVNVLCENE